MFLGRFRPWQCSVATQAVATIIVVTRWIKLKFHGAAPCSILVTSSSTRPTSSWKRLTRVTSLWGCYKNVARVRRLPCSPCHARLPDWSVGGLLQCSAARLSCRSPKSTSTSTTCMTSCRFTSILVRHAQFLHDTLARMSRVNSSHGISVLSC